MVLLIAWTTNSDLHVCDRIKDTFSGLEEGGDDDNHDEDDDDNWLAKWKPDVGEISKPILEYQEIIVKGTG